MSQELYANTIQAELATGDLPQLLMLLGLTHYFSVQELLAEISALECDPQVSVKFETHEAVKNKTVGFCPEGLTVKMTQCDIEQAAVEISFKSLDNQNSSSASREMSARFLGPQFRSTTAYEDGSGSQTLIHRDGQALSSVFRAPAG